MFDWFWFLIWDKRRKQKKQQQEQLKQGELSLAENNQGDNDAEVADDGTR